MSEDQLKKDDYGFGFKLDDFQLEAIDHINNKKSVVVCAPTGAGKTVIAEFAIKKALSEGKRVFYTTPLKALSNQKFNDFAETYGADKAGLLTGDISMHRDAQIVVMTTEVFRNMLYGTNLGKVEENLKDVQYIILDEVHYMNDEQRGTVWEESIIYCPSNIQIVALSATIANAQELTDWINTVHGHTALVNSDFRPVPLRHYYFSPSDGKDILPLLSPGGRLNSKISPERPQPKVFKKGKKSTQDNPVAKLVKVLHEKDMLPAIYFTFSRKRCDENVEDCAKLKLLNKFEERRLMQIIDEYVLDNPYLSKHKHLEYLYSGVASHHAGLLPAWKTLVEKLFKQGLIKVVFATETLAAGINMPARTTVISAISKRTDDGHRILTASEFLQMSGRAGRRGMDEVGHVVVIGSAFESPEEMAALATSQADPLGSKFAPSYSMVLNLLQRFSIENAKELILKSFGYYTSSERLKPLLAEQQRISDVIDDINSLMCPHKLSDEDVVKYNKLKSTYIEYRKLANTLKKQARDKRAPEVLEYEAKAKSYQRQVDAHKCNTCRVYKKHIKNVEVGARFVKKQSKIARLIEYEKDVYWRQFQNLARVLEDLNYLNEGYPTEKGLMASGIRSENEVFFAELINSGILTGLSHGELAAVLCAATTEEPRGNSYIKYQVSPQTRMAVHECRDILKKLWKKQAQYEVEMPILLNPHFSALIEMWADGWNWDDLVKNVDLAEGDIVRTFKRTIDLLRQLTIVPNVPAELVETARTAMLCIDRDPISDAF